MAADVHVDGASGKNFRSSYYGSLVRRGEEKSTGRLESLLTAESVDLEAVKQFCQSHTLPPHFRLQVWKLVLGVVPPYNDDDVVSYVRSQRQQQYSDLQRVLHLLLTPHSPPLPPHTSHNSQRPFTPHTQPGPLPEDRNTNNVQSEHLLLMYLLESNRLPTIASVTAARTEQQDLLAVGRAFVDLGGDPVDTYFMFSRFVKKLEEIDIDLLRASCFGYLDKEDSAFRVHMETLSSGIPFISWFKQCFGSTLPDYCLESIWDRVIGGCVMMLVFLTVAVLLTFKRRLWGVKTSQAVREVLTQIPEENFSLIVQKAVQLWESHGAPLLPEP